MQLCSLADISCPHCCRRTAAAADAGLQGDTACCKQQSAQKSQPWRWCRCSQQQWPCLHQVLGLQTTFTDAMKQLPSASDVTTLKTQSGLHICIREFAASKGVSPGGRPGSSEMAAMSRTLSATSRKLYTCGRSCAAAPAFGTTTVARLIPSVHHWLYYRAPCSSSSHQRQQLCCLMAGFMCNMSCASAALLSHGCSHMHMLL